MVKFLNYCNKYYNVEGNDVQQRVTGSFCSLKLPLRVSYDNLGTRGTLGAILSWIAIMNYQLEVFLMDHITDVIELLSSLMTTRFKDFSLRVIPSQLIETIKTAIIHTANTSNRQIYSVITLNQEQMKVLGEVKGSNAFVFCVDFNRLRNCANLLNLQFDTSYLTQFMSGIVDVSLLAQSAIIAAKSFDIDTLITNELYLENDFSIYDKLNIPSKHCVPVLTLYLGYSDKKNVQQKGRLPNEIVFHDGKYKALSNKKYENLIKKYDNEDNHLCLNDSWVKMKYMHYLEWFFEKWSPIIGSRKNCEEYIKELARREIL